MSRKNSNSKDLTKGLKGWEKKYIANSLKYGHLEDSNTSKYNKYKKER